MSIIREFARFIEPTGELEYDNTTSGLSATTIKSAIDELNTLLGGGNVGSQATFSIYEFAASGGQTIFDLSGTFTTGGDVTAGNFITNETYKIQTTGDTDFTLIGAADSNPGTVFTATGPGTGTGTARVAVTYIPGYIQVYVNGVFIASTDYTASSGQTVILTEAAEASDLVTVVVLDSFNTATQLRVINVDASAPDDSLVVDNVGDVSVTSDIKLADNGKAIFGGGSDLQIYHDGLNSYIDEVGTGDLFIRGGADIQLQNGTGTRTYATFTNSGDAKLFYNNTAKLATTSTGIDVSGNIIVDSAIYRTDTGAGGIRFATAGNIRPVNTSGTSTDLALDIGDPNFRFNNLYLGGTATVNGLTVDASTTTIQKTGDNPILEFKAHAGTQDAIAQIVAARSLTSGTNSQFYFKTNDGTSTLNRVGIADNGDISFYDTAGSNAKLFWDASAESLGIGTTSPDRAIKIEKDNAYVWIADAAGGNVGFIGGNGSNDGLMRLYEGTGHTAKVEIHSNADSYFNGGNVGIGTDSPSYELDVSTSSGEAYIRVDSATDQDGGFRISENGTNKWLIYNDASTDALAFYDNSNVLERMRIDSSGNVKITNPNKNVSDAEEGILFSGALPGLAYFTRDNNLATSHARLNSYGGIIRVVAQGTAGGQIGSGASGVLSFYNGAGTVEHMRIDSAGNLLVGTTQTPATLITTSTTSHAGTGISDIGYLSVARDLTSFPNSGGVAFFNRLATDGPIADFRKDGATVGSITTVSAGLGIGSGDTGLYFESISNEIRPFNTTSNASIDAAIDLGNSTKRFKNIYASGTRTYERVTTGTITASSSGSFAFTLPNGANSSRGIYEVAIFGYSNGGANQHGGVAHLFVMGNPDGVSLRVISEQRITIDSVTFSGGTLTVNITNTDATFDMLGPVANLKMICDG